MKVLTQRALDRILGTVLCYFCSLFPWRYRYLPLGVKPQKILVIILSEMGSLVLAKPMFEHIKSKYPQSIIHLLVFERNREIPEILQLVPVTRVFTVNTRCLWRFLRDSLQVLIRLRKIKIDTVFDCELFSRISSIYSLLSGARIRAGFHPHTQEGLFRGNFINRPILYNPYTHITRQFITMVEALEPHGMPIVKRKVSPDTLSSFTLNLDQGDIDAVSTRFSTDFPHIRGKELVLIYPGGGLLPIRAWPVAYFCHVAEDLIRRGYAIGIIGMEDDRQLAHVILAHCRSEHCVDLTGYTKSIRDLIILLHLASLIISNDGGPGHFAAMTRTPSIVLYGPETPTLYGTLSSNAHFFYVQLPCSPCLTAYNHRNSPCDGDNVCLRSISPDAVLKKAYEILGNQEVPQAHQCPQ
jgi:lipopolysaccharide heptosyltransferase II